MGYATELFSPFSPYVLLPVGPAGTDETERHNPVIIALLKNRAVQQVHEIHAALKRSEFHDLPPVLLALDRETRGASTRRVMAMLAAYGRFLTRDAHADVRERLDPVFGPTFVMPRGRYAVTSPALLVIQSILYSHCEWFQDPLWETHSAIRAYADLSHRGFPERHSRAIAAFIAHQTLVRTAWSLDARSHPLEAFAYYLDDDSRIFSSERHSGQDDQIAEAAARAIAATLFNCLLRPNTGDAPGEISLRKRRVAAAQVLHSLCLQARNRQCESARIGEIKLQALRFFDYLIEPPDQPSESPTGLVFIHYGRYVYDANPPLFKQIMGDVVKKLKAQQRPRPGKEGEPRSPANFTLCLPRVASGAIWNEHQFNHEAVRPVATEHLFEADRNEIAGNGVGSDVVDWAGFFGEGFTPRTPEISDIKDAIKKTVGTLYHYDVNKKATPCTNGQASTIEATLGLSPGSLQDPCGDCAAVLEALIEAVRLRHLDYWQALEKERGYLPTPLVGHVLRALHDFRPELLRPLHIIAQEPRTLTKDPASDVAITVWIPNYDPGDLKGEPKVNCTADQGNDSPAEIWNENLDHEAYALVARYVAAIMVGLFVSFAPRRLVLDWVWDEDKKRWGHLVGNAFDGNGGPLMRAYAEQVCARRAECDLDGHYSPWPLGADAPTSEATPTRAAAPPEEQETPGAKVQPIRILGIDVGGTSIKAEVFEVRRLGDMHPTEPRRHCNFKWGLVIEFHEAAKKCERHKERPAAQERVEALLRVAVDQLQEDPQKIDALGISLAAPVADGVPVGWSTVFDAGHLDCGTKIIEANSSRLHEIDFAKAAEECGFKSQSVAVFNDGEADILASELAPSDQGQEGVHLVLKEGTGVAFAVFENGKHMSRLAETAKAILNLCSKPKEKPEEKPFPDGQFGQFVSKKKLPTLLKEATDCLIEAYGADGDEKTRKDRDGEFRSAAADLLSEMLGAMLEQVRSSADTPNSFIRILETKLQGQPIVLGQVPGNLATNVAQRLKEVGESILDAKNGFLLEIERCHDRARLFMMSREAEKQGSGVTQWLASLRDPDPEQQVKMLVQLDRYLDHPETNTENMPPTGEHDTRYVALLKGCSGLVVPRRWRDLEADERYAIAFAWVLGRWLADAIALSYSLYEMTQVRLAGGPLRGATGIYIAQSARAALKSVYGFDLDPRDGQANSSIWHASTRCHGYKVLRVIDPPEGTSENGTLGAAIAARDAHWAHLKLEQLRACRDHVANLHHCEHTFTVSDVVEAVKADRQNEPWVVSDTDVTVMLEWESAGLNLTSERGGVFRVWSGRETQVVLG